MAGREKRCLGDFFSLTKLLPGACSALRHAHSKQDEFIYILSGHPVLITDMGETQLSPGMCAGDAVVYPDDDLQAVFVEKTWQFMHKDGSPY
jgi:hypothetical protein